MKGGLTINHPKIRILSPVEDLMVKLQALLLNLDEKKLKNGHYTTLLNCVSAGWSNVPDSRAHRFYYELTGPWITNMYKRNYTKAETILSDILRVSGNKTAAEAVRLGLLDIATNIHSFCTLSRIPIDPKWSQVSNASQSSQLKLMEGDMLSTIREMRVLLHEF